MSSTTQPTQSPVLQVAHCANGLLLAMAGPVCVALWQSKPTPGLFERQRAYLHGAVAGAPGQVAFLCVVEASADPPEEAERKGSASMITLHGAKLRGVACVIEGVGFRAAITRTVLSGMVMMIRTPSPIRLFDGVRPASPWLCRSLTGISAADLEQQVERCRAQLGA